MNKSRFLHGLSHEIRSKERGHKFAHFQLSMDAFNMNGSASGEKEGSPFLNFC